MPLLILTMASKWIKQQEGSPYVFPSLTLAVNRIFFYEEFIDRVKLSIKELQKAAAAQGCSKEGVGGHGQRCKLKSPNPSTKSVTGPSSYHVPFVTLVYSYVVEGHFAPLRCWEHLIPQHHLKLRPWAGQQMDGERCQAICFGLPQKLVP